MPLHDDLPSNDWWDNREWHLFSLVSPLHGKCPDSIPSRLCAAGHLRMRPREISGCNMQSPVIERREKKLKIAFLCWSGPVRIPVGKRQCKPSVGMVGFRFDRCVQRTCASDSKSEACTSAHMWLLITPSSRESAFFSSFSMRKSNLNYNATPIELDSLSQRQICRFTQPQTEETRTNTPCSSLCDQRLRKMQFAFKANSDNHFAIACVWAFPLLASRICCSIVARNHFWRKMFHFSCVAARHRPLSTSTGCQFAIWLLFSDSSFTSWATAMANDRNNKLAIVMGLRG